MLFGILDWATYSCQHFVSIVEIFQQHGNLRLIRSSGKKLPKSSLDTLHDANSDCLRDEKDSGYARQYIQRITASFNTTTLPESTRLSTSRGAQSQEAQVCFKSRSAKQGGYSYLRPVLPT